MAGAALLALAAPASADPGAYVRARAAAADGAVDVAAAGYAQALAAAPDDQVIAIRAYREGLAAGDYGLVRRAAAVLVKAGVAPADTAVLAYADALHANDMPAADAALMRLAGGPLDFMTPVLRAWMIESRGEDGAALLEKTAGSAIARRYGAEHRGLLLIASGRAKEGLAALQPLFADDEGDDLKLTAATLLTGMGKKGLAKDLLGPDARAARKQIGKGAKPSPSFGAARLFVRVADDLQHQDTQTLSILLTRAALLLDPTDDHARVLLAGALAQSGANDGALTVLAEVRPDGLYGREAREATVGVLGSAGRAEEALSRAKALADAPGATSRELQSYGDLLAGESRYADAADAYRRAIDLAGEDAGWVLNLQLGGALEQAGRWDQALPVLRHAVELGPNQPAALNYLGYALADRRQDLPEAEQLLTRASQLAPDNAAISDSLAWAYFQKGEVAKAVPLLEKAAKAEPADPEINEHLGDAYWRIGRRFEARYAWRAAAIYAEDDAKKRIEGKLQTGLEPHTAAN